MDEKTKTQLEAGAFQRLVKHFQEHAEVQNIDLMIMADFCRNCLAKWYVEAAKDMSVDISYEQAREIIYGMPYKEWQAQYQTEATPEQLAVFEQKLKAKS